ncbi:MAG: serine/threonine protein kinase, partial [Kofleriaceae bacterium]
MTGDKRRTESASTVTFAPTGTPPPASPVEAAPTPARSTDGALVARRQAELDRQEQIALLLRFRSFLPWVVCVWVAFTIVDWTVARYISPGPLTPFLLLRGGFTLVLLYFILRIHRRPPIGPREFRILELGVFVVASVVISIMGLFYGGIATPYFAGVLLAVVARAAIVAQRWQAGLRDYSAIIAAYPVVFGIAAVFRPGIRDQFADSAALATFAHNLGFLLGAVAFVVVGSHVTWSLRRQVFETRSIGRYRLRRCIGRGGMGEVWAAHDETLKRDVALKILRPERVNDEWLERFRREARATAELTHIHTVRIFDYGASEDGIWYYAMELLEGETLRERVSRSGPIPAESVRRFAIDLAGALAEAHARGIVHRDVKPENLFIATIGGERDVIKLLDFGLAKTEAAEEGLTRSGWIGGTPTYISPEAAAGKPVDQRSDVYSLGASLYFALTGAPPFDATSIGGLFQAHMHDAVVPPSQ